MDKIVGLGQISLTDLNDAWSSVDPPKNPSVGNIWVDMSSNPVMIKRYNGTLWEDLGELDPDLSVTITEINETLGSMADDNKIDFKERQIIKDKLINIVGSVISSTSSTLPTMTNINGGSFKTIRQSALNAGIEDTDSIYVALGVAYNNLRTYLQGMTPIKPWNTSNSTQKTIIEVNKEDFRNRWLNYYLAEESLAMATANKLKQNVDDIDIGGRNLVVGTKGIQDNGTGGMLIYDFDGSIMSDNIGKPITVSFKIRRVDGTGNKTARFYFRNSGNAVVSFGYFDVNEEWIRHVHTFTITQAMVDNTDSFGFQMNGNGSTDNFAGQVKEFKVEFGNKATDWTPAPEDIDISIENSHEFNLLPLSIFEQGGYDSNMNPNDNGNLKKVRTELNKLTLKPNLNYTLSGGTYVLKITIWRTILVDEINFIFAYEKIAESDNFYSGNPITFNSGDNVYKDTEYEGGLTALSAITIAIESPTNLPVSSLDLHNFMLNRGTIAQPYQPYVKDMVDKLDELEDKVTDVEFEIGAEQIMSKVSSHQRYISDLGSKANQTALNALTTRVSNAEQKITDSAIINTVTQSTKFQTDVSNVVNSGIDNLQGSSYNLIRNYNSDMIIVNGTIVSDYEAIINSSGSYINIYFYEQSSSVLGGQPLEPNTDYVFRLHDGDAGLEMGVFYNKGNNSIHTWTSNRIIKFNTGDREDVRLIIRSTSANQRVGKVSLYKSNITMDWTPSPIDVEEGIVVGGRNLANTDNITVAGTTINGNVYTLTSNGANNPYIRVHHSSLENDTWYVATFKAKKISGNVSKIAGHSTITVHESVRLFINGVEQTSKLSQGWSNVGGAGYPSGNGVNTYEVRFKTVSDMENISTPYWYIQPNRPTYGEAFSMEIWDFQIEKGNKATDWSPAPEDVDNKIDGVANDLNLLTSRVQTAEQKITPSAITSTVTSSSSWTTLNNTVNGKASQTALNNLTTRVNTAEQKITDTAIVTTVRSSTNYKNDLNGKLNSSDFTGTEIVSKIEQTASNVTISAKKINFDGHVFGSNATFTGTIEGAEIIGSIIRATKSLGSSELEITNSRVKMTFSNKETIIEGNMINLINGSTNLLIDARNVSKTSRVISSGGLDISTGDNRYFNIDSNNVRFRNEDGVGSVLQIFTSISGYSNGVIRFAGPLDSFNKGSDYGIHFANGRHVITQHTSNDGLYIYPDRDLGGSKTFVIRSHTNHSSYRDDFWINHNGAMYNPRAAENTTTASANVRIHPTSGYFYRSTSARKSKIDIQDLGVNPYLILGVSPRDWYDKNAYESYSEYLTKKNSGEYDAELLESIETLERVGGLVAEEVEDAGLGMFVEYGENGRVEGLQYDRLWINLIPIVRDHNNYINDMLPEILNIKDDINDLKIKYQYIYGKYKELKEKYEELAGNAS